MKVAGLDRGFAALRTDCALIDGKGKEKEKNGVSAKRSEGLASSKLLVKAMRIVELGWSLEGRRK
jgi:hypothetical protein